MMSGISGRLAFLCLFLTIGVWIPISGETLKCHVCNSLFNESCAELVDDRYIVECAEVNDHPSKNHTICRSEVLSVSSTAFDLYSRRTIRSCGYTKHPKYDCYYNSNQDLKETICECEENGCNGCGTMGVIMNLLLCGLLFSYLMSQFR